MIPWLRIAAVLAALGAIAGAGWHYRATVAERDALAGRIQAAEATARQAQANITTLQEDARRAYQNADKLEQDRAAIRGRLDAALRESDGLRVIADLASRGPPTTGTSSGSGDAAGACGLSAADAADLARRVERVRGESLRLAASADTVAVQLSACQAEVRRLEKSQ